MRRRLRAGARLLGFFAVGLLLFPALLAGRLLLAASSERRARWRARIFRLWSRALLRLLGVRLEVTGPVPDPPFFLVANHLGYLDVVVLASRLEAVFVAKSEVAGWPLLGAVCRQMDTIFVDRASRRDVTRVLERTRSALSRGDGVVLFPEGTSSDGSTVLPFLPALLATPARLGLPVRYASLSYSTPAGEPPADRSVCWWGEMTFTEHFWGLLGLARIDARVRFGPDPIGGGDRKLLAAALHDAVRRTHVPVVGLSTR